MPAPFKSRSGSPPALQLGEEWVPPNEASAIAEIERMIRAQVEHDYPPGVRPARRDQHPKAHGCVRAQFTVSPDVPEKFRYGLFKEPCTYEAWVRFSSSSSQIRSDLAKDAHGMAIKLMGVEGPKILPEEVNETTQDFVLAFTGGKLLSFFFGWNPRRWRLHELKNMLQATQKAVFNPLQIRYWSQTPYRLGPHAVKYSAIPHVAVLDSKPASPGPDYLEEAMARQLRTQEAVFDFLVQAQTDPVKMPVEDATIVWDEKQASFVKVATLCIEPQRFDSPEQKDFSENLSFTPWHALPEHRPLGNTNRTRRLVYESISKLRHKKNVVPRKEPVENENLS
jgi:hypothetical protein